MPNRRKIVKELSKLRNLAPKGYWVGFHIRRTSPTTSETTYNREWLRQYSNMGYWLRDPILGWGMSTVGYMRTSDLPKKYDPYDCLVDAAKFSLKYSACFSLGQIHSRSIANTARDDRPFTDEELKEIYGIIAQLHVLTEPQKVLSANQIEALQIISTGARQAAAADTLGISESALKARLVSARGHLNARTTSEAIYKAKVLRLL